MPSNYTPNYSLNQWEAGDRVQRTDFNADNAKIDAAIKVEADTRAAGDAALSAQKADKTALNTLTQTLNAKGNCRIATGSYTGTGTYGANASTSLTFPFQPKLVILSDRTGSIRLVAGESSVQVHYGLALLTWKLTWNGNSVSWYIAQGNGMNGSGFSGTASTQLNEAGVVYRYVAFGGDS